MKSMIYNFIFKPFLHAFLIEKQLCLELELEILSRRRSFYSDINLDI